MSKINLKYLVFIYHFLNKIGTYISFIPLFYLFREENNYFKYLSVFFVARGLGTVLSFHSPQLFINKFGDIKAIIFANFLAGTGMVLISFNANSFPIISFLLFFIGFFENLETIALSHLCSKRFSERNLLKVNHSIELITFAAMILGVVLSNLILSKSDIRITFLLDAFSFYISALFVLLTLFKHHSNEIKELNCKQEKIVGGKDSIFLCRMSMFSACGLAMASSFLIRSFDVLEIPYYLNTLRIPSALVGPFFSVTIIGVLLARKMTNLKSFKTIDSFKIITIIIFFWNELHYVGSF